MISIAGICPEKGLVYYCDCKIVPGGHETATRFNSVSVAELARINVARQYPSIDWAFVDPEAQRVLLIEIFR